MNILTLKDIYETDKNKVKEIEVLKYLPFVKKHLIVDDICAASIKSHDNGLKYLDGMQRHLVTELYILRDYVGIEFDNDDFMGEYDWMKENGLVDYFLNKIPKSELNTIDMYVFNKVDNDLKLYNTMEGVLANTLNKLVEKMPNEKKITKWFNGLKKKFEQIDPENFKKLNEMLDYAKGNDKEENNNKKGNLVEKKE